MIKVADTSMIGCYPISSRQSDIEDLVHVAVNRDVGIEKDACLIGGELERSELGPGVFEAGSNEGCFLIGGREKRVNALDNQERVMFGLKLQCAEG